LDELQRQRKVLELTEEQKRAIQALIMRQSTPKQIFASFDFWLGRVLPGAFFFVLGVLVTLKLRATQQGKATSATNEPTPHLQSGNNCKTRSPRSCLDVFERHL